MDATASTSSSVRHVQRADQSFPSCVIDCRRNRPVALFRVACDVVPQSTRNLACPRCHVQDEFADRMSGGEWACRRHFSIDPFQYAAYRRTVPRVAVVGWFS